MKKLSLSLMLNVSLALMLALSLIYPQSVAVNFVAAWAILATVICVVAGGVGVYATEYVLERYLIEVREWWQLNEEPGTFRIVVGVLEQGITEEMYQELERLVADAKPASRHLTGLAISLSTTGNIFAGAGCYHGDALTVYPYTPEAIIVGGDYFPASAIHLIDNLRVNA